MGTEQMTDRFQYVWKPLQMYDDWKVDGGVGTKDGYAAVAFTAAGEWYIFVDMPDRNLAPRPGEVEMLTEGDIFDYGKTLWELSK